MSDTFSTPEHFNFSGPTSTSDWLHSLPRWTYEPGSTPYQFEPITAEHIADDWKGYGYTLAFAFIVMMSAIGTLVMADLSRVICVKCRCKESTKDRTSGYNILGGSGGGMSILNRTTLLLIVTIASISFITTAATYNTQVSDSLDNLRVSASDLNDYQIKLTDTATDILYHCSAAQANLQANFSDITLPGTTFQDLLTTLNDTKLHVEPFTTSSDTIQSTRDILDDILTYSGDAFSYERTYSNLAVFLLLGVVIATYVIHEWGFFIPMQSTIAALLQFIGVFLLLLSLFVSSALFTLSIPLSDVCDSPKSYVYELIKHQTTNTSDTMATDVMSYYLECPATVNITDFITNNTNDRHPGPLDHYLADAQTSISSGMTTVEAMGVYLNATHPDKLPAFVEFVSSIDSIQESILSARVSLQCPFLQHIVVRALNVVCHDAIDSMTMFALFLALGALCLLTIKTFTKIRTSGGGGSTGSPGTTTVIINQITKP